MNNHTFWICMGVILCRCGWDFPRNIGCFIFQFRDSFLSNYLFILVLRRLIVFPTKRLWFVELICNWISLRVLANTFDGWGKVRRCQMWTPFSYRSSRLACVLARSGNIGCAVLTSPYLYYRICIINSWIWIVVLYVNQKIQISSYCCLLLLF